MSGTPEESQHGDENVGPNACHVTLGGKVPFIPRHKCPLFTLMSASESGVKDKKAVRTSLQNTGTILPSQSFPDWKATGLPPSVFTLGLCLWKAGTVGSASPLCYECNGTSVLNFLSSSHRQQSLFCTNTLLCESITSTG